MSGMIPPTPETMPYEGRLTTFNLIELKDLLRALNVPKIHEIDRARSTQRVSPYPRPTMSRPAAQINTQQMLRQNTNLSNTNGPLPTMNQNTQQMLRPNMNSCNTNGGNVGYVMVNRNQLGNVVQQRPQGTMSITPRPARNLTPMTLPFYDIARTLLEPQELPASNGKMAAAVNCQFTLSPEHFGKLSVKEDEFPRTEVQMRFFNVTGDILNIEQPDDFPLDCRVKINDYPVTLPNMLPHNPNKPKVEPKRESRPVNITQYLIRQSTRDNTSGTYRMHVDWTADTRKWAVAVYLVTHVNSEMLRERIVRAPSFQLPYETTEATIRKRLGGDDDDDVAMDSLKISLLCPLGKTRMNISARSRDCTHIQCFDLALHLQLNEKRPTWKCGVCNGHAPYHKLIIDKYFMKMLNDLGSAVTDVELLKDGTYRVIKEDDPCDISDDDDAPVGVSTSSSAAGAASSSSSSPSTSSAAAAKKADAEDIITLSDDDEEDEELRNLIRSYRPGSMRTPVKAQTSPSADDDIIILDDTPPRPVNTRPSENQPADRPILTDQRLAPSSSTSATATASTSSWNALSSSSAVPRSSTAARGGATSSTGATTGTGEMISSSATATAFCQAAGSRSGLLLGGGPLSATAVGQQQNIYNWQQPQSAPPTMTYNQQMQFDYGGYINAMQYSQSVRANLHAAQAYQASNQLFSPSNCPIYSPNFTGTE